MADATKKDWIPLCDLNERHGLEAARLIYLSLPTFYDQFDMPMPTLLLRIRKQFGKKNSELEHGYTILADGRIVGVYTAYPAGEMTIRQTFGLLAFQQPLSPRQRKIVHEKLFIFWSGFSPIPKDSYYLARIAVDEKYRGQGIAHQLMNHFAEETKLPHLSLHVFADNLVAMAFYRRCGYINNDRQGQTIYMLSRDGSNNSYIPTSPSPNTK